MKPIEINTTVKSVGLMNDGPMGNYLAIVNNRVEHTVREYTDIVQEQARGILSQNQYVWTGKLERGITTSVKRYIKRTTGTVHTGRTPYAMALHEGTPGKKRRRWWNRRQKNKDDRYFVPFSVSPSLKRWAKHKGFDVESMGGLKVSHPALKYMEEPFNANLNAFLREMGNTVK